MPYTDRHKTALFEEMIDAAGVITLTAHGFPDGDAIGSSTALCRYLREARGKDAVVALPTPVPDTMDFLLPGVPVMVHTQDPEAAIARIEASDLLICLDCNAFNRTEGLQDALAASKARKVLIDHHLQPDQAAFDLVFSTPDISSASELLFWILLRLSDVDGDAARLPAGSALALMAGMTTDTNNFANSVWPTTFEMASALLAAGVDRDALLDKIYNSGRENRLRLVGTMLKDHLVITPEGAAVMVLTDEIRRAYDLREGESEGLVNMPLTVASVRLSVLLKQYPEESNFHVSLRSKRGVSAARLARTVFHGGGHELASGGRVYYPGDIPNPEAALAYAVSVASQFLSER